MQQKKKAKYQQAKMVGWYDPVQLGQTGIQVALSAVLGARADYRLIETLMTDQDIFDYSDQGDEIWIDYVADLGDGWNSTYTIATLLARSSLTVPGESGKRYETNRGNILIMGGDEVYPTASREGYQTRLIGPYECALKETDAPHPHLFAIPGNHDWYDGLISFTRLFCQGRWLGGWLTQQKCSYFALKLPHHWWLLGVDIQLEADIDFPQLEYFRDIAENHMAKGDKVILCTAAPDWIYGNIYQKELEHNLAYLEKEIIEKKAQAKVVVTLAGDLHHYRRHQSLDGLKTQKITSGGGGAFLHPTSGPNVDKIPLEPKSESLETQNENEKKAAKFEWQAEFPTREESKRLALKNLLFPWLNPWFGLVTGAVYLIISWLLTPQLKTAFMETPLALANIWQMLGQTVEALAGNPSGLVWVAVVAVGFVFFADFTSKPFRFVAGSVHAFSHLLANLLIGWLVTRIVINGLSLAPNSLFQLLLSGLFIFVGGYLVGSILMGLYLLISINLFGMHLNEAFSSLAIEDYKNFLRLHLDAEGKLTIYPIGVRQVPKAWTPNPDDKAANSDPQLVPKNSRPIECCLIEELPISWPE